MGELSLMTKKQGKDPIFITPFGATVNINLGLKWLLRDGHDVQVSFRDEKE